MTAAGFAIELRPLSIVIPAKRALREREPESSTHRWSSLAPPLDHHRGVFEKKRP
jgi:hypothetical protein